MWDLFPSNPLEMLDDQERSNEVDDISGDRPQPTALVIQFSAPLTSVSSHPSTSKQLVISDSRGSVFFIDWRKDPTENDEDAWHGQSVMELLLPKALARSVTNISGGKVLMGSPPFEGLRSRVSSRPVICSSLAWDILLTSTFRCRQSAATKPL